MSLNLTNAYRLIFNLYNFGSGYPVVIAKTTVEVYHERERNDAIYKLILTHNHT